ncbi:regulatory protein [Streptomyces sp. NL15-2K]|nr:hypothetical protein [Kutzneria buriramensis]WKX07735.1 hypothetical protein Q4V64_09695 [Kutzneria buriramensis]GCB50992.1 regulatory protein [Streptomyces sp. NL15-2K]
MYVEEALLDAIMAGASGYVLKQIKGSGLVSAVRTVASGQSMLDPATTARLMLSLRTEPCQTPAVPSELVGLSPREKDILGRQPRRAAGSRAGARTRVRDADRIQPAPPATDQAKRHGVGLGAASDVPPAFGIVGLTGTYSCRHPHQPDGNTSHRTGQASRHIATK